ncbi:MAG: phage holin family protein [Burkholderiales bacterium]|nr:phage holin family protein [Burkholderiales bacterium]
MFSSVKKLLATAVGIVGSRVELLSVEFEEEIERLAALLFYAVVSLFFLGLAVILISILIVVAFRDEHRLLALGLLATFFSCIGIFTGIFFLTKAKTRSRIFSQSLAELSKDLSELE